MVSYVLAALLKITSFVVSFINLFVSGLLGLMRLKPGNDEGQHRLSPEELRGMVLESNHFIPQKHRSILVNLFELEDITVEDVMTPRGAIEALDLGMPADELRHQIATSYHTRSPVFDGEMDNVIGLLHLRRMLGHTLDSGFDPPRSVSC